MSDVVYQCPQCGSPAVEYGELVNSSASCRACKWVGLREQLLATPFEHMLGTRDGIGFELFNDVRRLLTNSPAFLVSLGGFLARWGFVDLTRPQNEVVRTTTRYVAAIASALLRAVIEERNKIEEEANRE